MGLIYDFLVVAAHNVAPLHTTKLPEFIDFVIIRHGHCQKISGRAARPSIFRRFRVWGTRETEWTQYCRVFLFFPLNVTFDLISINLKWSSGAINMFIA